MAAATGDRRMPLARSPAYFSQTFSVVSCCICAIEIFTAMYTHFLYLYLVPQDWALHPISLRERRSLSVLRGATGAGRLTAG